MSFEKPHPDKLQSSIIGLLSQLKTDSRHIISKYRALESSEAKLVDENRRLNSVVTALEAENNAEKSNTNALRAKITVLTQQLLTKDQYADSLLADERARWEGEVQRQQKVCEALQEELVRLKTSTFEWVREKDAAQRERTVLQNKIQTLASALEATTRETQEWRVAFDKAQTQKNEFLTVTAETMAQISDCAAKMRDMEAQEELRKKRVGELEVLLRERDLALSRAEAECVRMEGDKMVIEYELRRTRQQLDICRSRLSELIRKRREEATAMAAHMQERGHGRKETAGMEDTLDTSALTSSGDSSGSGGGVYGDIGGSNSNATQERESAYFGSGADMNMDMLDALLDSNVEFEDKMHGRLKVRNETADASLPSSATHTSRLSETCATSAGTKRNISSRGSSSNVGADEITVEPLQTAQRVRVQSSTTTTLSMHFSFASSPSSASSSSSSMDSALCPPTSARSSPTTNHAHGMCERTGRTSTASAAIEAVPISASSQERGETVREDADADVGAREHASPLLAHTTAHNSTSREKVMDVDVVLESPVAMGAQATPVAVQNKRKSIDSPRHMLMKRSRNENSADNAPIPSALPSTNGYIREETGGTWVYDGGMTVDSLDAATPRVVATNDNAAEAHKYQSPMGGCRHSSPLSHPVPSSSVSTSSPSCVSSFTPDLCTDERTVLEKDTRSVDKSVDVETITNTTSNGDAHGMGDGFAGNQTIDSDHGVAREDDVRSDDDDQGPTDTAAVTDSTPISAVTTATTIISSDAMVTDTDAISDETRSAGDTLMLKIQPQANSPVTPPHTVASAADVCNEAAEERVSVVATLEDVLIQMWDSPPTRRHAKMVATVPTLTGPHDEIDVSGSSDAAVVNAATTTGAVVGVNSGVCVAVEDESNHDGHHPGCISRSCAETSEDLTLSSASDDEEQFILIVSPKNSPTAAATDVFAAYPYVSRHQTTAVSDVNANNPTLTAATAGPNKRGRRSARLSTLPALGSVRGYVNTRARSSGHVGVHANQDASSLNRQVDDSNTGMSVNTVDVGIVDVDVDAGELSAVPPLISEYEGLR